MHNRPAGTRQSRSITSQCEAPWPAAISTVRPVYVLNGCKIYITNAAEAGVFTVFATLEPGTGARGITAFLVESGTPGLELASIR